MFLYNLLDLKRTAWEGYELAPGKHTIVFDFKPAGPGLGKGESACSTWTEGSRQEIHGSHHADHVPGGRNLRYRPRYAHWRRNGGYRYDVPFKFTGTIDKVTFKLGPAELMEEERKQLPAVADAVARAKD